MTGAQLSFEAYAYRVSARFGSRVRISIADGSVTIAGPRLSLVVYRAWIAAQAVLLAWAGVAFVVSLILRDWRGLVAALLLLLVHLAVSGFGAGCLWELANLTAFLEGTPGKTVSFPLDTVNRVKVGRGWARRGMWLLILPYVAGINSLAERFCVSFEAPDGDTGREVVYALHMQAPEEARALAALLERGGSGD